MNADRKRILFFIVAEIVVILLICIGNFSYQRDLVNKHAGSANFEPLERARGRGGKGGYLSAFGVIPTLVSYLSEDFADKLSEMIFNTSGRKGRQIAVNYKQRRAEENEIDEIEKKVEARRNELPKDAYNMFKAASKQFYRLHLLYLTGDYDEAEKAYSLYKVMMGTFELQMRGHAQYRNIFH